jgi:hypothetical protein
MDADDADGRHRGRTSSNGNTSHKYSVAPIIVYTNIKIPL